MDPKTAPAPDSGMEQSLFFFCATKAFNCWSWHRYLCTQCPAGKTVLNINCDESSIAYWYGSEKGNICVSKKQYAKEGEPVQKATLAEMRLHLTYVCFICDDPTIQPLLPQILIGNHATFKVKDMLNLLEQTPSNVYLCRRKSAWNNSALMVDIVQLLGKALADVLERFFVILSLDAAGLHCTSEVVDAVYKAGLNYLAVPARLTWLLQPCDTHLFSQLKRYLRSAYMKLRTEIAADTMDMPNFLQIFYAAVRFVVQGKRWKKAFLDDGFGRNQEEVSKFIRRSLEWTPSEFPLLDTLPTKESILDMWPKKKPLPYQLLFKVLRPQRQLALPAPPELRPGPVALENAPLAQNDASARSSADPALPAPADNPASPPSAAEWQLSGSGPVTRSQTRLRLGSSLARQLSSPPPQRQPSAAASSAAATSSTSTRPPLNPAPLRRSPSRSSTPSEQHSQRRRRGSQATSSVPKRQRRA